MLPGTAQIWIEALTHGRSWDQARDESRIRAAFLTLANTRTQWPGPLHFLQALPDSTQLRISGPGARPTDSPELREALEAVRRGDVIPLRSVDDLRRELSTIPNATPNAEKAAIEADLRRHYGRDGKAAAAGADQ